MTMDLSRRLFMGAAASGATIAATTNLSAMAKAAPSKEKYLFGPDPADAHLIFNENPFGPSPAAIKALSNASTSAAYYQGKSLRYLSEMIAERHSVDPSQIVITNGSYEVLTAIALAYGSKGSILGADLFWDSTAKYAERNGYAKIVRSPMTDGLEIDLDAMEAMVDDSISLVHVVNPNNPTGRLLNPKKLRKFTKKVSAKKPVLIDEAYMEISDDPEGNSMMDLVRAGHDVIIGRTFSKIYGMAGLRIGYIITTPEIAKMVRGYVISSPNIAGIAAAIASYNDEAFLTYSKSKILEAREMITDATKAQGLNPLPSQTSFVFVDTKMDANLFRDRMAEKRVLIRGVYGEYSSMSRVSAGYIEDVKRYVDTLAYAING